MTFLTIAKLVAGLVLLVAGAEALVRGASRLAALVGISPLVIGLTIVAYGTSSPGLAGSSSAVLRGGADLAIGNVVGSNIFNVALILGISAMITPLAIAQQLIRIDVPLMIGVSFLLWGMAIDGSISRPEGIVLFAGAVSYTVFAIVQSRRETAEVREEYGEEFGIVEPATTGTIGRNVLFIVAGFAMLVFGSDWLIEGAVAAARAFGVSELIISLTMVAAGTSLPELATSLVAAARGERDIAVGNVVGSNIFNILAVLGVAGTIAPHPIVVAPDALRFDIPAMTIVAAICIPIFFTGKTITRWEGAIFVMVYVVFFALLVARATHSPVFGVIPLP